jgi:hypothetical protein
MTTHKHRWQRLSDTALFCECGETKVIEEARFAPPHLCPQPFVFYPPVVVPACPEPRPYWQWPNTTSPNITVTGGTTSPSMAGITVWNA